VCLFCSLEDKRKLLRDWKKKKKKTRRNQAFLLHQDIPFQEAGMKHAHVDRNLILAWVQARLRTYLRITFITKI
jgi:hypothetical protein